MRNSLYKLRRPTRHSTVIRECIDIIQFYTYRARIFKHFNMTIVFTLMYHSLCCSSAKICRFYHQFVFIQITPHSVLPYQYGPSSMCFSLLPELHYYLLSFILMSHFITWVYQEKLISFVWYPYH